MLAVFDSGLCNEHYERYIWIVDSQLYWPVVSAKDLFVEVWRMLKICRSKFRPRFVI